MALETKVTAHKEYTPEERKKFIAKLREYHQEYFNKIENPSAAFITKMKYGYPPDRAKFYVNEINSPKALYVEWVSRDYIPEDDRNLYKYKFNSKFEEEYPKIIIGGVTMFEVPSSQFELVKPGLKESQLELGFDVTDPDHDSPIMDMTLRDFAALMLKTPVSRKEWLNELIKKACQK